MQDRVQQYPYQPLPTATSIRLIRVLPDRIDGSIVCSIQTVDSGQQTEVQYQALSYLWGNPKPTRRVYIRDYNGDVLHEHHLHENLWQFLDKWQQPRTQPSGLLWTDSLCLNQADSDERGQQVRRMGEIYSGAKEVIVWLGPDSASMEWIHVDVQATRTKMLNKQARRSLDAAIATLQLPYWRRAWIVQEVVLAQRVLVTCGNISIELNEFQERIPKLYPRDIVDNLCDLRRGKGKSLWWILHRLGKRAESTRAVDKVFGFLGLVSPHEDGSSPIDHITVNYARRPIDVLFDAVFEARPPFRRTRKILTGLEASFGRVEEACGIRIDAQALSGYLRERGISERHAQFASLALRVSEAVNIMAAQLAISPQKWSELTGEIGWKFSRKKADKWVLPEYSPCQHAAFVGFNLNLVCEPLHEDSDTLSLQRQASQWLCLTHGRQPGPLRDRVPGVFTTFKFDTGNLARLCARHSLESGCDVSMVYFEIPEIGFRIAVSPGGDVNTTSGFFHIAMSHRQDCKLQ